MKKANICTTVFNDTATTDLSDISFITNESCEANVLNVFPEVEYQKVLGFGGAFTESAAYCYSKLGSEQKEKVLKYYFSEDGLGYNFCRTHINSCDFSLDEYVYVEDNDTSLKSFSIKRDKKYIIPFIKDAQKYTGKSLMLFASPWSAPAWMKTNNSVIKGGKIKKEYLPVWAEYYCKYIKAFANEGIEISAITVQNEPIAIQTWESCQFSAEDEALFVRDYLAPALKDNGLSDIKIIIWDHNKERVYDRARDVFSYAGTRELVWGIGFHWYSGHHFDGVQIAHKMFPEKVLIETEYCTSFGYENFGIDGCPLGYAVEMLGNFNNGMSASVDWNMILDTNGGPYHDRDSGCNAAIIADTDNGDFKLTNIYHNVYHFAHFIKRGAVRIGTSSFDDNILITAFRNPDGEKVAVILNTGDDKKKAQLRLGTETAELNLPPVSVSTVVIK